MAMTVTSLRGLLMNPDQKHWLRRDPGHLLLTQDPHSLHRRAKLVGGPGFEPGASRSRITRQFVQICRFLRFSVQFFKSAMALITERGPVALPEAPASRAARGVAYRRPGIDDGPAVR
jgi:hypothetical protein